jgi:integrase
MILLGLQAVRALDRGLAGVREGTPRHAADPATVEKAIPFMSPVVQAVVQLLRLTGARPSEILLLTPAEINRSGAVWDIHPKRHKSRWRGKARAVYLGPDAQAVLGPWLDGVRPDDFVFSP